MPRRTTFNKEIRQMMYGFGDVSSPRQDSAELIEQYTIDYIKTLLTNTMNMACIKGKTKTEDVLWMLRHDRLKFNRVKDLLLINEELKNARKLMDYEEYEKEQ